MTRDEKVEELRQAMDDARRATGELGGRERELALVLLPILELILRHIFEEDL